MYQMTIRKSLNGVVDNEIKTLPMLVELINVVWL